MSGAHLPGLVRAAAGKRIVCVGDVMLDRFIYGGVTRISPEAPVPIMRRTRESAMPGGAGNVARNLASLGLAVSLIGVVGDDGEGRELAALLGDIDGVEADLIAMRERATTLKTRFVAGGQQLLRVDAEDTSPIGAASEAELIASIADEASRASVIILSDYAKGAVTDGVIAAALAAGKTYGIPVIADPKGRDFMQVWRGGPDQAECQRTLNRHAAAGRDRSGDRRRADGGADGAAREVDCGHARREGNVLCRKWRADRASERAGAGGL